LNNLCVREKRSIQVMASLSQYPASKAKQEEIIEEATIWVELSTIALFVFTEEKCRSGDVTTMAMVPMTLPTICRDTSLGVAAALAEELKDGSTHLSSQGILRQSFFVASRGGYAQREEDSHLPKGFIHDAASLVHDSNIDTTLLTQTSALFSKGAATLTNLKARPSTADDVKVLTEWLSTLNARLAVPMSRDTDSSESTMGKLCEAICMIQHLRDNGYSYEELFNLAKLTNANAFSRFSSTALWHSIRQELAESAANQNREMIHYLAFHGLLKKMCPIFLSPVTSATEALAELMARGGLVAKTDGTKVPHLALPRNRDESTCSSVNEKVSVTIYGPREASSKGLAKGVRYLFQTSMRVSRSIGTSSASVDATHR